MYVRYGTTPFSLICGSRFYFYLIQIEERRQALFEPHREKTGFLPMRKQSRRSASR